MRALVRFKERGLFVSSHEELRRAFVATRADAAGLHELGADLAGMLEEARLKWPNLRVDDVSFVRFLAERLPDDEPAGDALPRWCVPDLYLAFACLARDKVALDLFEREVLSKLPQMVSQLGGADTSDEIGQQLREKMIVGGPDAPPRLAAYTGQGSLTAWVRVAAMRAGLNMKRGPAQRTAPVEAADALPAGQDIDVELFRKRYRQPFEQALRDAMQHLDPYEVSLLQMHFVNGMGLAEIGAKHGVHKSTISRQLARARGVLLRAVRERMQADMGLRASEVHSVARAVRSNLEVSISSLLGPHRGEPK